MKAPQLWQQRDVDVVHCIGEPQPQVEAAGEAVLARLMCCQRRDARAGAAHDAPGYLPHESHCSVARAHCSPEPALRHRQLVPQPRNLLPQHMHIDHVPRAAFLRLCHPHPRILQLLPDGLVFLKRAQQRRPALGAGLRRRRGGKLPRFDLHRCNGGRLRLRWSLLQLACRPGGVCLARACMSACRASRLPGAPALGPSSSGFSCAATNSCKRLQPFSLCSLPCARLLRVLFGILGAR
eukprot:scaffold8966_cov132-Isochrysis_galbana.AAC.2